ncbi:MAG: hypothetical protein GY698_11310 [Actinomycetia bacterium]|nr:hypothetical protein [Actinomycetes bacterium]
MREQSIEAADRREWERPQLVSLSTPSETGGGPWAAYYETGEVAAGHS